MSNILVRINDNDDEFLPFIELFTPEEGRAGVIVTFIAVMELIKESLLSIVQTEAFAPIHVKASNGAPLAFDDDEDKTSNEVAGGT